MCPRRISPVLAALLLVGLALAPRRRGEEPAGRPVYKNPMGVTLDEKGESARVVLAGIGATTFVDLRTGKFREEDGRDRPPASPDVTEHLKRLAMAGNVRAVRATKEGVLAAHQRPKSHVPATQVPQGWVFTNAVTLLRAPDDGDPKNVTAVVALLDQPQRGFADPADAVLAPDGTIFVACAGADAVLALDLEAVRKHGIKPGAGAEYAGREDLTASRHYVRAVLPTQANPRRLALSGDGKTLVVSNYLADSLTVIDAVNRKVVKHIPLGGPEPDSARRGEVHFNSARLTFQGQFTCASCHPDGGADGLNWDLTRDGVGNFKNTKSLFGVKDTAPYGWLGTSPTLEDRVRGTLRTLHRHEPFDDEVRDLTAYLGSLPPPAAGPGGPAVARGKELFEEKARCAGCHGGAAFDDGKLHDVGTGDANEERLNTPSLRGVRTTAPYLHDGRADTLEDVFLRHNRARKHGAAHALTEAEFADLVAYLKTF